jgi:DNA polymerase-3 subunit delta'
MTMRRPQDTTNLYGHQDILNRLYHASLDNKLHHSLIFAGPNGVGKETLAYHLMRKVFGASPNHIFTSNLFSILPVYDEKKQKYKRDITLDSLEGLSSFLHLSPTNDKPRFILINPADGMNVNTQNAVLKILEEPPKNTYFILLSDSIASLLPTIRSRCMAVVLEPLSAIEMQKALSDLLPQCDLNEIESYHELSQGIPGRVLMYDHYKILLEYDRFCQVCCEWIEDKSSLAAMAWAQQMSGADQNDLVELLINLILQRLALLIKKIAMNSSMTYVSALEERMLQAFVQTRGSVPKMLQDHERLQRLWDEAFVAYLDRKISLLSFFRVMAG